MRNASRKRDLDSDDTGSDEHDIIKEPSSGNQFNKNPICGAIYYRLGLVESRWDIAYSLDFGPFGGRYLLDPITIERVDPFTHAHELARRLKCSPWTGNEHTVALAARWLARCREHHQSCSKFMSTNWYPTRLLDVASNIVRLITSADKDLNDYYATLSHCWGREKFLVLTAENLPQLLAGIPIMELPLTFRETIRILRNLGIRYVWIDCYCIIQGTDDLSTADWIYESARMGQVYTNSLLNIGAAASDGPGGGLFRYRDLMNTRTTHLRWRPSSSSQIGWYRLINKAWTYCEPLEDVFRDLQNRPLMKRAWVVQECVLSPRMLTFTEKQVFWQCPEYLACEDIPQDKLQRVTWTGEHPFWALTDSNDLLISRTGSDLERTQKGISDIADWINYERSIHRRWFYTLERYCEAGLTYPDEDIFKAIDGVGVCIAQLTNDTYQFGHLGSTFPQALLWQARKQSCGKRSKQRAPTWHWATYGADLWFFEIAALFDLARDRAWRFSPVAHLFISDNCRVFLTAGNLWPYLMCIGRLIKVEVKSNGASPEKFSVVLASSEKNIEVTVDYEHRSIANLDRIALLPLITIQRSRIKREPWLNSDTESDSGQDAKGNPKKIIFAGTSALLLHESGHGTLY